MIRRLLVLGVVAVLVPPVVLAALLAYGISRDEPHAFDDAFAARLESEPIRLLAPGPRLPATPELGPSNNNLDVTRSGGRFYLALRTAPHHFASDEARIEVYASDDRERWRHEASFDLERRDLREPRFLAYAGRLFLYFVELEDDPFGFTPVSIRMSERGRDGVWTESAPIFEPGHIVWRTRVFEGRAYMSVYHGVRLYDDIGAAGAVRLLVSEDGRSWRSLSGDASPIDFPGASEAAFEFDEAGNLVALVRTEAYGALVCTAPAERLERWDCSRTPYRHDSPLLFRHGRHFYAVARRSLGGPLDRGHDWLPGRLEPLWYLLRYSASRKRTAVYRIEPETRRAVPLLDLPSRADTAFASHVPLGGDRFWIVNYSSDPSGPDYPWIGGQLLGSQIYDQELRLPAD